MRSRDKITGRVEGVAEVELTIGSKELFAYTANGRPCPDLAFMADFPPICIEQKPAMI